MKIRASRSQLSDQAWLIADESILYDLPFKYWWLATACLTCCCGWKAAGKVLMVHYLNW